MICKLIAMFSLLSRAQFQSFDDVRNLTDYLLDTQRYRVDIRPTRNQSEPIQVNVTHVLKSIVDVNVEEGYITTTSEFKFSWKDEYLLWNSSEFDGIEVMWLQPHMIWTPCVTVVDIFDGLDLQLIERSNVPVWVEDDGTVTVVAEIIFKSKCDIDESFYPFDKHTCHLELQSPKYCIRDVELKCNDPDFSVEFMHQSPLWEITETMIARKPASKAGRRFATTHYMIKVKRKIILATFQGMIPLTGMFVLNMITPFVPFESGERLTFCISIYLAFVIASDSELEQIPGNLEGISISVIALLSYNVLNTLTVAWTVFILCMSRRQDQVPQWLCKLAQKRAKHVNQNSLQLDTELTSCNDNSWCNSANDGSDARLTNTVTADASASVNPDVHVYVSWPEVTRRLDIYYFYFFIVLYISIVTGLSIYLFQNGVYEF